MKIFGVILGVIIAILGIMACAMPVRTFLGLGWLVGIILLVCGIQMLINALIGRVKNIGRAVLGVVLAFVGICLLCGGVARFMTDVFLVYLVGATIIIYGIYQIVESLRTMREDKMYGIFGIIVGVVSIIAGAFGMGHPILSMLSLGILIGFALIMQGINLVLFALRGPKTA